MGGAVVVVADVADGSTAAAAEAAAYAAAGSTVDGAVDAAALPPALALHTLSKRPVAAMVTVALDAEEHNRHRVAADNRVVAELAATG